MGGREIIHSKHAMPRILRYGITEDDVERAIREGERIAEGKSRARYVLRTGKSVLIAICSEYPDVIEVITVTVRRRR